MNKINFIIAAYNEENRIRDVINSISKFSDQIIVLDPGSSDNTIEFAKKTYPIKVCHVDQDMFNIERRIGSAIEIIKSNSRSEWIFMMNCGERFSNELGERLLSLINSDLSIFGISLYRQSYTFGVKTHNTKIFYLIRNIFKTTNNFRLLKYSAWDVDKSRMHAEFPILSEYRSKTVWLKPFDKFSLLHYRLGELDDFEMKHSIYSSNEANELWKINRKASIWSMCTKPLIVLLYFFPTIFVSRKAFIVATYHAFYKFQVEAKLYLLGTKDQK